MRKFTVYFTSSTDDVITIIAEEWELENDLVSFSVGKIVVACFNMKNIYGFEELIINNVGTQEETDG